ncbi:MAG: GNAT family N-acetyltransferase [Sphingomonas sp.]|uniref:GNAT family N-acetyltransferase n=1 Tax=Sphingomonas sp. TaxID=28214 RepID=UPI0025FD303B|nr:GNAT family N-acetyltransferase [Sphingomonas sp.]MBY0284292.1 GNAT family N-acetyltransferase [Sphingomonas sp.]
MIETGRLIIRPWRERDRAPYFALNADPEVRRYLGPAQSRAESDAALDRQEAAQALHGHCFWALERRDDGVLIGFCGLLPGKPPIEGKIEIGWRLGRANWQQGYAREAAEACLAWGWANLSVPAIYAITVPANTASWGLMERLGMQRVPDGDFDHPELPEGDPLRQHITYAIDRP